MKSAGDVLKPLLVPSVVLVACFLVAGAAGAAVVHNYRERIGPQVYIGTINVGGMTREQARQAVLSAQDALITNGIPVLADGETANLPLSSVFDHEAVEDALFDTDLAVQAAWDARHHANPVLDAILLTDAFWRPATVVVPVTLHEENLATSLRRSFPELETPARDATFAFAVEEEAWTVTVVPGSDGYEFAMDDFFTRLQRQLAMLDASRIPADLHPTEPAVSEQAASERTDEAAVALNTAPYTLTFEDDTGRAWEWSIDAATLASMLKPSIEESLPLALDPTALDAYLSTVSSDIEIPAQDARFTIEDGRVTEFVGSRAGRQVDTEATATALRQALHSQEMSVALAVKELTPDVTTGEVNDLGITDVLGVGTSSYAGSPGNRIKNIRNAVRLLNGILIAPDETFSLIEALSPFTYENGYFPELVIKGDKIEPEMGGGACQIGTTTFRATMNSGLPVTERRNHSLVVSYYNDPANGNPGTDATIYEPSPDYKFKNDTGRYILFQAEMIEDTQELRFTFWGTHDGRKGSYSPPVVTRWLGTGAPIEKETTELEPGVRKCQGAHVGADAVFTYTVTNPDGTVNETVFESHYRPLPTICLVGVEPLSGELSETDGDTTTESTSDANTDATSSDAAAPTDTETTEPAPTT